MVSPLDAMRELQRQSLKGVGEYQPVAEVETLPQVIGRLPKQTWPDPLAEEAYHGIAGEIVRAIEPNTEADPVAVLVTFLVCVGNAIGRNPFSIVEADRHGTNLFAVLMGETAKGRKGSSTGHIRKLIQNVDPLWESNRIISGMASGEGLVWHVRDAIEKEEPIKDDKNRPTGHFETKVVDPGIEDKRMLAYEPEFASVLKVMNRDNNTLSTQVRQAWDAVKLQTLTKNNPAVSTDPHISILGHITKDELLRHLNDTEAANGFANRFMWFLVKRSKVLPEGGGEIDYQASVPMLHEMLNEARKVGKLERDPDARKAWAHIYPELSEGKPGLLGSVLARSESQVLRLSVLYAALDGDSAIRMPHLMAASAIWEYAERSALHVFGDATGDPVADRIIESLRTFESMNRTEISGLFKRNVPSARINQALALLLQNGKARFETQNTEGRPMEVWLPL